MKILTAFLFASGLAFGQYSANPPTTYPALDTNINSKLAHREQAGAPSGACTVGKDVSTNTTTGDMYWCIGSATWAQIPKLDANGNLPLGDGTVSGGDFFFELSTNGSNFAWLGAQDSMSANYGWGLPTAAPTPGTPYCVQFGASVNKTVGGLTVPVFPLSLVPCTASTAKKASTTPAGHRGRRGVVSALLRLTKP